MLARLEFLLERLGAEFKRKQPYGGDHIVYKISVEDKLSKLRARPGGPRLQPEHGRGKGWSIAESSKPAGVTWQSMKPASQGWKASTHFFVCFYFLFLRQVFVHTALAVLGLTL